MSYEAHRVLEQFQALGAPMICPSMISRTEMTDQSSSILLCYPGNKYVSICKSSQIEHLPPNLPALIKGAAVFACDVKVEPEVIPIGWNSFFGYECRGYGANILIPHIFI